MHQKVYQSEEKLIDKQKEKYTHITYISDLKFSVFDYVENHTTDALSGGSLAKLTFTISVKRLMRPINYCH